MKLSSHHPRHAFALTDLPPIPSVCGIRRVYRCAHCGLLGALSRDGTYYSTVGFPPVIIDLRTCDGGKTAIKALLTHAGVTSLVSLEIPPDASPDALLRTWARDLASGEVRSYLPGEITLAAVPHRVRRRAAHAE